MFAAERTRSSVLARIMDGTPLILIEGGNWRSRTMRKMLISHADVMAVARDGNMRGLDEIGTATLERNGEISIVSAEDK